MSRAFILALATGAHGSVFDVLMPHYKPGASCSGGCMPWSEVSTTNQTLQAFVNSLWENGKAPVGANNSCAMPAASAGQYDCDGCKTDTVWNSYQGPWCVCSTGAFVYCEPPTDSIPEQVNLQMAAQDIVVVSFVTHDAENASSTTPAAEVSYDAAEAVTVNGITHYYSKLSEAEDIPYYLHFIKLQLPKGTSTIKYRVHSGTSTALWSEYFTFRAPVQSPVTRIGIYGDMGHSRFNNMGNLLDDCEAGTIDMIAHMGDHAYDMGGGTDRRGDAYMNAFMPVLSRCPWIPIIGNHEKNDGDSFQRYLNMSWGETLNEASVTSTADTALGELLTKSTLFGAGFHSNIPSNTSRFFSIDVGLVHFVGLDLNFKLRDGVQLSWLEADLASVDRSKTPWVVVSSHFPLYHAKVDANTDKSAAAYLGETGEHYAYSGHEFQPLQCDAQGCEESVGELLKSIQSVLDPLFHEYHVDLYIAGHVHDYNSNFPLCFNLTSNTSDLCQDADGNPIRNFANSKGTVHITEGNGGVPGVLGVSTLTLACNTTSAQWCRSHGTGGAYGRLVAYNATAMSYEHVQNNGSVSTDFFVMTK